MSDSGGDPCLAVWTPREGGGCAGTGLVGPETIASTMAAALPSKRRPIHPGLRPPGLAGVHPALPWASGPQILNKAVEALRVPSSTFLRKETWGRRLGTGAGGQLDPCLSRPGAGPWPTAGGQNHQRCLGPCQRFQNALRRQPPFGRA